MVALNQMTRATQCFEHALRLEPSLRDNEEFQALTATAMTPSEAGAATLAPNNSEALTLHHQATAKLKAGDMGSAIVGYSKCISLEPNEIKHFLNRSLVSVLSTFCFSSGSVCSFS